MRNNSINSKCITEENLLFVRLKYPNVENFNQLFESIPKSIQDEIRTEAINGDYKTVEDFQNWVDKRLCIYEFEQV